MVLQIEVIGPKGPKESSIAVEGNLFEGMNFGEGAWNPFPSVFWSALKVVESDGSRAGNEERGEIMKLYVSLSLPAWRY